EKQYGQAQLLYEQATKIATELKANFLLQDSYRGMAWIHLAKKEMPEAETMFTNAIELSRTTERPAGLWEALYGKAVTLRETNRAAESLPLFEEAVDVIERARNEVQLSDQKASYFEEKRDVYEDLVKLLIESNQVAEAFEYAQRSKARAFLDMLAE